MKNKKEIIEITQVQLLAMLQKKDAINGGTFFGILADTEVNGIAKPKACGLDGVRKITATVGHVYAHHQYKNQMLKKDASYVSKPRAWGERMQDFPLVIHKDKYYLEVFFDENQKSVTKNLMYYMMVEGTVKTVDKETIKKNMRPKEKELVVYRNYSLDSILELRMNGNRYKIVR